MIFWLVIFERSKFQDWELERQGKVYGGFQDVD